MPVVKRILYDPSTYHNVEVFREASAMQAPMSESAGTYSSINDIDMSKTIGVMTQLSCLSVFALEMFHNLALLSEDINDRIKILSMRTNTVLSKLPAVEKKATSLDHEHDFVLVKNRDKYLKNRDMITPPLFIKKTNYCSITNQYKLCTPLPQLWRIEMYIKNDEDCFKLYSFPGFFFQEWLRSEIILQEKRRLERKAEKVKRKKLKKERHKQREEEREELYLRSLERAARVAELEEEAQQLDIDDDLAASGEHRARPAPDGHGVKLGKKQRQQQPPLSILSPQSSILQVNATAGGGNRRGSVDIDEDAVASQNDDTEEEIAVAQKKKTKMTKVANKLGKVFGFKKKNPANKNEEEGADGGGSESEGDTATGGGALSPKRQPGSPEATRDRDAAANAAGAASVMPPMGFKTNAFSKLFKNFNAKDDLDELDMPAETVTPTSEGNNGKTNNGNTKRPSQSMDNLALSMLTGSRGGDKNGTNIYSTSTSAASAGRGYKNSALAGEEDAHGRRRSVDNGPLHSSSAAAAAAAALKFTGSNAMMDMDEGAADMFVFASTVFPSRNSRKIPKPKAGKRPSQSNSHNNNREDESERSSEQSGSRGTANHRNNQKHEKKRSSFATLQEDAKKRGGGGAGAAGKAKTRFSDSVENGGSVEAEEEDRGSEDRSLSPVDEQDEREEDDEEQEEDEERTSFEEEDAREEEEEEGDEDRPPSDDEEAVEGEEQEEADVDDDEEGEEEADRDDPAGSAEGEDEPVDYEEEEGGSEQGSSSRRQRHPHLDYHSENGSYRDDESKTSGSARGGHSKHHSSHHHHHHHNQQPPQFHNQQPPARRASTTRRESISRRASATAGGRGAPPPPPPPPTLLLKKAAPPPPPPPPKKEEPVPVEVLMRKNLFDSIKSGNALSVFNSNKASVAAAASKTIDEQLEEQKKVKVSTAKQNEYVAAILANRSKIAGSDSESSDSDSDYTDDDYG